MRVTRTAQKASASTEKKIPQGRRKASASRSEEHTSELQSQSNLVCRLLLEKKKNNTNDRYATACDPAITPDCRSKCVTTTNHKDVAHSVHTVNSLHRAL